MEPFRICIINIYFGRFPNYFDLWLQSAKYNRSIDFLLVTDQDLTNLPSNVHTLKMDLVEFSERATETIGMPIKLKHAYKCCDFKVAYGLIFEEELKDYDFWGHCDVDLIWGNIRRFVTDDVLTKYDKIYPMGHFALYRNNKKMRKAFMLEGSLKGDYKEVFTHQEGYAFDELSGIYEILKKNHIQQYDKYDFADISPIYSQMKLVERYVSFQNNYPHQIFMWTDGKIYRYYLDKNNNLCQDEFVYLHMQKRIFRDEQIQVKEGCSYLIAKEGFFERNPYDVKPEDVKRWNCYRGKLIEYIERKKWNLKMRKERSQIEIAPYHSTPN